MSSINEYPQGDLTRKTIYFILSAIASVPIFLAISAYIKTIQVHEDEAVATAATGCFIGGVFLGRYFAGIWAANVSKIPYALLIQLSTVIVISIAWLFYHADYPMEEHGALNLLLYWIPFLAVSMTTGILIKLVRTITKNQLKEAQTSAANSQSELHLLQSQLSPHFLFNTLNNLYGLSLTQHEKIPRLLLKLSDLLRYSVYESNENYVPLKDELAYIDNYIEFEKIRIGDRLVLTQDIQKIENSNIKIAPMLLIVFIENAFKHSKNTAEQYIYIDITLKYWGNDIMFSVKNSHSKQDGETVLNKNSGFGLNNVRKRLHLLYAVEHELTIESQETSYLVMLRLKMK